MRLRFLLLPFLLAAPLLAQSSGATVSGTVFCDDTGKPAHFARVFFVSTEPDHVGEDFLRRIQDVEQKAAAESGKPYTPPNEEDRKQQAAAARQLSSVARTLNSTNAGLDAAIA